MLHNLRVASELTMGLWVFGASEGFYGVILAQSRFFWFLIAKFFTLVGFLKFPQWSICFLSIKHIQRVLKWTPPLGRPTATSYSIGLKMNFLSSSANLLAFLSSLREWQALLSTDVPTEGYAGVLLLPLPCWSHPVVMKSHWCLLPTAPES